MSSRRIVYSCDSPEGSDMDISDGESVEQIYSQQQHIVQKHKPAAPKAHQGIVVSLHNYMKKNRWPDEAVKPRVENFLPINPTPPTSTIPSYASTAAASAPDAYTLKRKVPINPDDSDTEESYHTAPSSPIDLTIMEDFEPGQIPEEDMDDLERQLASSQKEVSYAEEQLKKWQAEKKAVQLSILEHRVRNSMKNRKPAVRQTEPGELKMEDSLKPTSAVRDKGKEPVTNGVDPRLNRLLKGKGPARSEATTKEPVRSEVKEKETVKNVAIPQIVSDPVTPFNQIPSTAQLLLKKVPSAINTPAAIVNKMPPPQETAPTVKHTVPAIKKATPPVNKSAPTALNKFASTVKTKRTVSFAQSTSLVEPEIIVIDEANDVMQENPLTELSTQIPAPSRQGIQSTLNDWIIPKPSRSAIISDDSIHMEQPNAVMPDEATALAKLKKEYNYRYERKAAKKASNRLLSSRAPPVVEPSSLNVYAELGKKRKATVNEEKEPTYTRQRKTEEVTWTMDDQPTELTKAQGKKLRRLVNRRVNAQKRKYLAVEKARRDQEMNSVANAIATNVANNKKQRVTRGSVASGNHVLPTNAFELSDVSAPSNSSNFKPYQSALSKLGLASSSSVSHPVPTQQTLCSAESAGGVCNDPKCKYSHFSDFV